MNSNPVLIDVKGIYDKEKAIKNGFLYWRLWRNFVRVPLYIDRYFTRSKISIYTYLARR
jgi:hypothetical protein